MIIQELNEFTWDMVRALPRVQAQLDKGESVTVECKPGLETLYKQFTNSVIVVDRFEELNDTSTYNHSRPPFTLADWSPPNLKDRWKDYLKYDKPVIVIQNKYTKEWGGGPHNYFPIEFLDALFNKFKQTHQIIYIRPIPNLKDYFVDDNEMVPFLDYELIEEKHPEVITIQEVLASHPELDYNSAQFAIHATSNKHISTSGGNACISAYFGGDLFIYDRYCPGGLRGIWQTNSWLKDISGSKVYGYSNLEELYHKLINNYNSI